jgi:hypothetical protein
MEWPVNVTGTWLFLLGACELIYVYVRKEINCNDYADSIKHYRTKFNTAAESGFEPWWTKFFGPPNKGRPAETLYCKSERPTLSCRVTCVWSERVNLHNRQIMVLLRNTKKCATFCCPGDKSLCIPVVGLCLNKSIWRWIFMSLYFDGIQFVLLNCNKNVWSLITWIVMRLTTELNCTRSQVLNTNWICFCSLCINLMRRLQCMWNHMPLIKTAVKATIKTHSSTATATPPFLFSKTSTRPMDCPDRNVTSWLDTATTCFAECTSSRILSA